MTQQEISSFLQAKGYGEKKADTVSAELLKMSPALLNLFEQWVQSGKESDYESHGMSAKGLMQKYDLNYPAALLSMNWVDKEPELAIKVINKGIR